MPLIEPNTTKWPDGAAAAFSITMDNMGEAQALQSGTWPEDKAVGDHPAVKVHLPRMLDLLDRDNIKATYFIESWNADHYPDAIRHVAARGHEVAWHGFQHENWTNVDLPNARHLLEKSQRNMDKIGFRCKGFRPPGGLVPEESLALLHDNGIRYISPAGRRPAVVSKVAVLPFEWKSIDAYYFSSGLARLRTMNGDPSDPMSTGEFVAALKKKIDATVADHGYLALLFHPFIQDSAERMAAMAELLEYIKSIPKVWIAPGIDVAEWVVNHQDQFGSDPGWDHSSWR